MTKKELIKAISQQAKVPAATAAGVLEALIDQVAKAVRTDGAADIPGLCKIKVGDRAARTGRNPKTGEPVNIPAARTVTIKAAASFKADALN